MDNRVYGTYETEAQAIQAIDALIKQGFKKDDLSIVAKDLKTSQQNAEEIHPTTTDGLIAGAATGGAIGVAGLFLGLGALALPGIGPILAAGPIVGLLGGAVAGVASGSGGLVHALMETGISEKEANQYANDVKDGKVLVILHLDSININEESS